VQVEVVGPVQVVNGADQVVIDVDVSVSPDLLKLEVERLGFQ